MNLKFLSAPVQLKTTPKKLALAIVFSSLCFTTSSILAADKVLAVVNGDNVTESQLKIAALQSKVDFNSITSVQRIALIDALVNRQLVLQAALKENFDKHPEVASRVKALTDSYIAANYLAKIAEAYKISDKEMQAYYDKNVLADLPKEYKARHILVKTKDEANAIIKELEGGADFSKLTKEKSNDAGSAVNGGDLGWFTGQNMVAPFSLAVAKMKKGELDKTPVKSQFGWHVIKLDDVRDVTPPKFEEVKPEIEKVLIKEHLNKYLTDLNSKAKITLNK